MPLTSHQYISSDHKNEIKNQKKLTVLAYHLHNDPTNIMRDENNRMWFILHQPILARPFSTLSLITEIQTHLIQRLPEICQIS
jgi:hypothetical protein